MDSKSDFFLSVTSLLLHIVSFIHIMIKLFVLIQYLDLKIQVYKKKTKIEFLEISKILMKKKNTNILYFILFHYKFYIPKLRFDFWFWSTILNYSIQTNET